MAMNTDQQHQYKPYSLFQGGLSLCDMIKKKVQRDNSTDSQEIPQSAQPSLYQLPKAEDVVDKVPAYVKPIERPSQSQVTPYIKPIERPSQSQGTPHIKLPLNQEKYWGIDFDNMTNRLYVTDKWHNKGHILDIGTGRLLGEFGTRATGAAEHQCVFKPCGVAVDTMRNRVMVVDKDNFRISSFTLDGQYISSFGSRGYGMGQFYYPWDVDVSPLGDTISVTDSRNHRVQIFDAYGNYLRHYSVFETNPFEYKKYFDCPRGVTYDIEGRTIFVSDFNKQNVLRLDIPTLTGNLLIPPGFVKRPQGMCRDVYGNILLADSRNNCVRVMNTDGDLLETNKKVGPSPVDLCRLSMGLGQAAVLSRDGSIYII